MVDRKISDNWKCVMVVTFLLSIVGLIWTINDLGEISRLDSQVIAMSKDIINVSSDSDLTNVSEKLIDLNFSIEKKRRVDYFNSLIWVAITATSILGLSILHILSKVKDYIDGQLEKEFGQSMGELRKYINKQNNINRFKEKEVEVLVFSNYINDSETMKVILKNKGFKQVYCHEFNELLKENCFNSINDRPRIIFINNDKDIFTNASEEINLDIVTDRLKKVFKYNSNSMYFYFNTTKHNFIDEDITLKSFSNERYTIASNIDNLIEMYFYEKEEK